MLDSPAAAAAAFGGKVSRVGEELVALHACVGRVLARDVCADRDHPACDVSAMDGYALRAADAAMGTIPIAADAMIGREPPACPPGAAVRIVTGAPIPAGADAVIKREDVCEYADRIEVSAAATLAPGQNVRPRAGHSRAGARVVCAGTIITAPVVGALATFGAPRVWVHRRVRVGVLSTGDELVPVDAAPTARQLRDSNGPALAALLAGRGWLDVLPPRHAPDDPQRLLEALRAIESVCDAVFVTGGVSMGVRDFIPSVVQQLGAKVLFHKVRQRPGKPMLGAVLPGGRPVFALPGNPVSALVTARRIAVPVLAAMAGASLMPAARVVIDHPDQRAIDLWWHRPVRISGAGVVNVAENAGSGDVPGAAVSDGFVELPPGGAGAGPWDFYAWTH